MAFTQPTGNVASLPIINTDPRRHGFAGLISDTSLLDIETVVIDKNEGGTAAGNLFRAGTIALVTSVNAKSGTRRARPAVLEDVDEAAGAGKRFVAITFSHDTCNQAGEIYVTNPDVGGVVNVKPANGMNTGRVWLFLNGAAPTADGRTGVSVADLPAAGAFDKTKPAVNGAASVATGTGATSTAIPGWYFTGAVETDPATGYQIAEVEVKRA